MPGALADELIAVVAQHPDLDAPARPGTRPGALDPFADRGQRDRARVDRVGLPRLAYRPPRGLGQSRRDPDDPLAAGEQRRAPGGRTRAGSPRSPTPARRRARAANRSASSVPSSLAGIVSCPRAGPVAASSATSVCLRLCVSTPITIMCTVPSLRCGRRSGSPADTPQLGRCHAPIKSRRRSSVGDGRHGKSRSDHTVDRRQRESARRRPRAKPTSRTTPTVGPSASH